MAKHTIGPWKAQAGNTYGQEVIAPGAPKTRRVVARCGGMDRDANARLIAAAPDMLEALRLCVSELGSLHGINDDPVNALHHSAGLGAGIKALADAEIA